MILCRHVDFSDSIPYVCQWVCHASMRMGHICIEVCMHMYGMTVTSFAHSHVQQAAWHRPWPWWTRNESVHAPAEAASTKGVTSHDADADSWVSAPGKGGGLQGRHGGASSLQTQRYACATLRRHPHHLLLSLMIDCPQFQGARATGLPRPEDTPRMPACWPWWERWMERMRRRLLAVHLSGFGSLSDSHSLNASDEVTLHRWSQTSAREWAYNAK